MADGPKFWKAYSIDHAMASCAFPLCCSTVCDSFTLFTFTPRDQRNSPDVRAPTAMSPLRRHVRGVLRNRPGFQHIICARIPTFRLPLKSRQTARCTPSHRGFLPQLFPTVCVPPPLTTSPRAPCSRSLCARRLTLGHILPRMTGSASAQFFRVGNMMHPGPNQPLLHARLSLFPASDVSMLFVALNHGLGDGHAISHFSRSWSYNCGGRWPAEAPAPPQPLGCRRVLQLAPDVSPSTLDQLFATYPGPLTNPLGRVLPRGSFFPRMIWSLFDDVHHRDPHRRSWREAMEGPREGRIAGRGVGV